MERAVSFDRVATEYEASRALPPELQLFAVAAIRREVGDDALLDVGVGTGRYALDLQRAGVRLTGCDVSAGMLREAWRRGVRRVCRADARRMPFRDASFPHAMSNHLLHLVRGWPELLGEVARVTRGSYLSVVEHEAAAPDLVDRYHQEVGARHPETADHPGIHEEDLVERVAPDRRIEGSLVRRELAADDQLETIDRRLYSSQWNIPDDAHRDAMRALRTQFAGARVHNELRIEVVVWDALRVADYVRSLRTGPTPPAGSL